MERTGTTDRKLTEMFGHRLTDADIRGLGGVPERCNVEVELVALHPGLHRNVGSGSTGVMISKSGDDPSGVFRTIQMTVYKDQAGNLNIYRDKTTTHTSDTVGDDETPRPTNLGACALVKQVDTARALGVSTIHNFSSQGPGFNGYYTWARYGGNASLAPKDVNVFDEGTAMPQVGKTNVRDQDEARYLNFRKALESSTVPAVQQLHRKPDLDVQDFMQTQEGRDFWRANGFALPLDFSLQPGSKTMQTMAQHTAPSSCFNLR